MTDAGQGVQLELHHRARIENLLAGSGLGFSEASFANLYLFRDQHDYRFLDGAHPSILGRTYDGARHIFPLSAHASAHHWPAAVECRYPSAYRVGASNNPDDSDYLYDADRLARLEGSDLKAKRQQAKVYDGQFTARLCLSHPEFSKAAAELLDIWQMQMGKDRIETDYIACTEAIFFARELGLETALMLSDGEPHGFLLASRLPDGSKAVHFAKARRDLVGSYPALFRFYAGIADTHTLNFEQDLGHRGLRQAKRSLAPRALLPKYRIASPLTC